MKKLVLIICSFIVYHCSFGQTDSAATTLVTNSDSIYIAVDQMPEFPDGKKGLGRFLGQNLRYPAAARNAGVEGTVFITFTISSEGDVKDAYVAKGIGYGCDEEGLRVVNLMPKWAPGMQTGRAVAVRYTLPMNFILVGKRKK